MQLILCYICCVKKENNTSFDNSLGPLLGRTMKLIEFKIEDLLNEHGIDLSKMQYLVLKTIDENSGISQNKLAFFSNRDKSSLTRMISTLKRKNYIEKHTCEEDKRRNKIKLTPEGQKVLESARPYFLQVAQCIEENISNDQKEVFIKILKQIQINISGEELA